MWFVNHFVSSYISISDGLMIFLSKYSDYCMLSIYYYINRRIYLLLLFFNNISPLYLQDSCAK
nr:MAG TPA: hypothetical protein [Caudoviricetes sp.]